MAKSNCSIEGCVKRDSVAGFCSAHFKEDRKAGLELLPQRTPQARFEDRFWAKVDRSGDCWEWTASKIKGHGHLGAANGGTAYAHRVSYELLVGPIPAGMEIDHMCHNRGCVNPEHLRVVTPKQNNENREGANPNSKSGVRGVHWRKDCKKWQVTIHAGPKMHHVGYFVELADAEQAAIAKRNELFTHNLTDRRAA